MSELISVGFVFLVQVVEASRALPTHPCVREAGPLGPRRHSRMVFLAMPSGPAASLQSMRLGRATLQAAEAEAEAGAARQSMALLDEVLVRPRQIAQY